MDLDALDDDKDAKTEWVIHAYTLSRALKESAEMYLNACDALRERVLTALSEEAVGNLDKLAHSVFHDNMTVYYKREFRCTRDALNEDKTDDQS